MKRTELNNIFTNKVNSYLAKGYTFHLDSMSGSQGEIGRVDLTNGEEVIRIKLESARDWEVGYGEYCFTITVGRTTKVEEGLGRMSKTIWNSDLEILEEEKFYSPSYESEYLTTKEEIETNYEKALDRRAARSLTKMEEITDTAIIKALLPYINHISGCKTVRVKHITRIQKQTLIHGGYRFYVSIQKNNKSKSEILTEEKLHQFRIGNYW